MLHRFHAIRTLIRFFRGKNGRAHVQHVLHLHPPILSIISHVIVSDCDADNVGAALSFLGNMVTVNCSDLLLNDDSILIILLQKLQGEGTGAMLPFYFICAHSLFIFQMSFLLFLSGHAQCARSKMSRVQVSRLQHAHRCV